MANKLTKLIIIVVATTSIFLTNSAQAWQSAGQEPRETGIQGEIEFARALVSRYHQEQSQLKNDLAYLEENLAKAEAQRDFILQKQFEIGISTESFADIMRSLQLQRVELTIDLAGLEARRDSLAEYNRNSPVNAAQKAIVGKLQEQIDILKLSVNAARLNTEAGTGPIQNLYQAQQKLLTAEIRLLEAQQASAPAAGESAELREVSLERAEKLARLTKVKEILAQLAAARGQIEEVEKLGQQGQQWRDRRQNITDKIREVQKKIAQTEQDLEEYLKFQENGDH